MKGFDLIVLYFVKSRIQIKRLAIMKECSTKNNIRFQELFSEEVTHIISDFESEEQVLKFLKIEHVDWESKYSHINILSSRWFTDSVKQGFPHPISSYKLLSLPKQKVESDPTAEAPEESGRHLCQKPHPLQHPNKHLTDALEILAEAAEFDASNSETRYLAFRKAAAALKALPRKVTSRNDVRSLKDIGPHSLRVIQELLVNGSCSEVLEILNSEYYKTVKMFAAIYGVGPAKARQWYSAGLRTLEDLETYFEETQLADRRILYGLAFYEDLTTRLTRSQCDQVVDTITVLAQELCSGVECHLVGGFRRGKQAGHDVDILFTHASEGREQGLVAELYSQLDRRGLVLHAILSRGASEHSTMDNFEKCLMIFKMEGPGQTAQSTTAGKDLQHILALSKEAGRSWRAIRVDLVSCPFPSLATALVGWTGNDLFNRSLKLYARQELGLKLSNHAIYDTTKNQYIPVASEEEVFSILRLPYLEPSLRNP